MAKVPSGRKNPNKDPNKVPTAPKGDPCCSIDGTTGPKGMGKGNKK